MDRNNHHQHEEISEATMVSPSSSSSSSTSLSTTGATNHGSQHHAYSILTIHDEPLPPRPPEPFTIMSFVRSRMAFRPAVPHDPRLFSARQKRWILVCLALGGSLNGFCSTIYFPGIPEITTEFGASDIEVTLTTSLFMLFGGIGPIMWASMSDYYHIRRFLYLVSLLIFSVASVGCAISLNVYMLIILRCVQSVGTSVTVSVGAGTVSDCWEITERGAAFSILFIGQFFGPLVGPILGGGLTTVLGWRSTFWFCAGYGIFLFTFLFFFLPETYRMEGKWEPLDAEKRQRVQQQQQNGLSATETTTTTATERSSTNNLTVDEEQQHVDIGSTIATASLTGMSPTLDTPISDSSGRLRKLNPVRSVFLLRHLFVLMIALETGSCFGTMFTIETVIPDLFETTYGFASWQTGLSYLGAGMGNILGSFVSGRVSDYLLKRARQKRGGTPKAEDRLTINAWPGGVVLVPFGVLMFGWGVNAQWIVWIPILAFGVVCFGMSQVYAAGMAYLVDSMPGQGASVTAASNLMRMSMAAVLSLIAQPVVEAIGPGYLSVLLAGLNMFGMFLFFVVKMKGQDMRRWAGYGDNQA